MEIKKKTVKRCASKALITALDGNGEPAEGNRASSDRSTARVVILERYIWL